MKFVMVVSILLCFFRSALAGCVLTGGDMNMGWVIRILKDKQTVAHGAIVSKNLVLSVFTAFIDVATSKKAILMYEFIGYENSRKTDFCSQERKAKTFIPPPEWPGPNTDEIRNIAFWETNESFEVSVDFPFLFPSNDDISKISQSTSGTNIGTQCNITVLANKNSRLTGTIDLRQVLVSKVSSCENFFCSSQGVCNLGNRFDFCTIEKRDTAQDSWERGAVMSCKGSPIAILALNGNKPKTTGRDLFISLLTAWQVYKKMPIVPATTTTTATTMKPTAKSTTTSTRNTITTRTTKMTPTTTRDTRRSKRSRKTKKTTTESEMSTISNPNTPTELTIPGSSTILTSRIPPPLFIRYTMTTTERPNFVRTIPRKVRLKPSKGSILFLRPGIYALCVGALYEGGEISGK